MNTDLAIVAAVGCALCNAIAAVLQKVSTAKVAAIKSYNLGIFVNLMRQLPYVTGLVLDLLAGVFTLIAVYRLPIFIVQAIIATCVVMTAFLEQLFLKRRLSKQIYMAAGLVIIGLACMGLAAHSESTASVSHLTKLIITYLPIIFVAIGVVAVKVKNRLAAALLASLSGLAFGFVSVIGRILVYPSPIWGIVKNPLIWALIVYGTIGMFFFTAALQRTLATVVNGVMISTETVLPLLIGILVLGDTARDGLWPLVWIGCILVISGCVYITLTDNSNIKASRNH